MDTSFISLLCLNASFLPDELFRFYWLHRSLSQSLFYILQVNPIAYWRKFVAEYYAPRAKKRWCLSLYDNVGQHALGVFPQAAMVGSIMPLCLLHLSIEQKLQSVLDGVISLVYQFLCRLIVYFSLVSFLCQDAWHCDICGSKSGRGFGKR